MTNPRDYSYTRNATKTMWNRTTNATTTSELVYSDGSRSSTDYDRRKKPTSRWVPPTSYNMDTQRYVSPFGSYYRHDVTNGAMVSWARGNLGRTSTLTTDLNAYDTFPSDLANRALIKARNKLKSQDINLGQAFFERGMTAGLVNSSLMRVVKSLWSLDRTLHNPRRLKRQLKRFNVRDHADTLVKDLPNHVLEVVYGWKPLLADIHGAVTALDKRDRDDWMVTVKARSTSRTDVYKKRTGSTNLQDWYTIKGSALHSTFVRIDACPEVDALRTAASLGLTNPLQLAWELLPFSFVVDWAWPLGDYFSSMDACAGWEIRGYSSSNLSKIRLQVVGDSHWDAGTPTYWVQQDWNSRRDRTRLNRSASLSVPFPMRPSIKNPASQQHVLNALALLAGIFRGKSTVR